MVSRDNYPETIQKDSRDQAVSDYLKFCQKKKQKSQMHFYRKS